MNHSEFFTSFSTKQNTKCSLKFTKITLIKNLTRPSAGEDVDRTTEIFIDGCCECKTGLPTIENNSSFL